MAELDLSGEQRLHGGRATTDVDQIGIDAMSLEAAVFLSQPERADARGNGAVRGAYWRRPALAMGRRIGANLACRKNEHGAGKLEPESHCRCILTLPNDTLLE